MSIFTNLAKTFNQSYSKINQLFNNNVIFSNIILNSRPSIFFPLVSPNRQRTVYNLKRGEPETVQDVVDRFYRLENGLWIRPKAGRRKRMWKKSLKRLHHSREHVFCNATQCRTLDKMVNIEYKKPHYHVDDPYEIYHRKSHLPDYRYTPKKFWP